VKLLLINLLDLVVLEGEVLEVQRECNFFAQGGLVIQLAVGEVAVLAQQMTVLWADKIHPQVVSLAGA
jgi:hypothetical protein